MATYPELSGKVIVVSGAGGNLGAAVLRRFYAEGSRLALMDRNEQRLREQFRAEGIDDSHILVGPVDLMKKTDIDQFVDRVVAEMGQIDVLVHTAGGYKPGKPVHEMDENLWDSLINLNIKTTYLLNAAIAHSMVAKNVKGRIINISGKGGLQGRATSAAYSAAKAGVLRLTESMASELATHDITVNAVLPSVIDTPQNREGSPGEDYSKWVSPESLAGVIAFLASNDARDISGASIPVYGKA